MSVDPEDEPVADDPTDVSAALDPDTKDDLDTDLGDASAGSGDDRARSDRGIKVGFAPVDDQEMLARLANLPLETWHYRDEHPAIRHLGPMAQDFAAAFCLGGDDRSINMLDANGVVMAAIQGLYRLLQEQDARIAALEAQPRAQEQAAMVSR